MNNNPLDDIRTLNAAADILHRHNHPHTANACLTAAATIAVNHTLGDTPTPNPGNRLTRLTEGH